MTDLETGWFSGLGICESFPGRGVEVGEREEEVEEDVVDVVRVEEEFCASTPFEWEELLEPTT